MAKKLSVVTLKAGQPTVEEARARLRVEIDKAQQAGTVALKIIHGYGSSGVGGGIKHGIRRSLRKRVKEGKIRGYVGGEDWSIFEETARQILDACPELDSDQDLNRYNEGVTIILL